MNSNHEKRIEAIADLEEQWGMTPEGARKNAKTIIKVDPLTHKAEELRANAIFLIDRLEEFEEELEDKQTREWYGHIKPAIARLKINLTDGSKE